MKIINPEAVVKSFEDFSCGKTHMVFLNTKDFEIPQSPTYPLKEYKEPENFPNCCPYHSELMKISNEKFDKFPDCCERHKKLKTAQWFNKSNYSYLPLKVVTTLAYTIHCISKCLESENWYREITDYIDVTMYSYGQLPQGFGSPVGIELYANNLERNIEKENEIPDDKKNRILHYIKNWGMPVSEVEEIDLILLITTYKTWLKDFPFEIPFFLNLKEHFEKQMPILSGKGETNIYTGITAFKLTTYKGLIEFLVATTEKILNEVNTLVLYEKGQITDIQKTNIDVINASHRFNLKNIKSTQNKERKQYSKIIKTWFKYEREYLSELTTALSKVLPVLNKTETKKANSNIQSP
ncbi:MAG: hypothetical protein ABIO04_01635, partial [Ferruginibacter sp.]